MSLNTPLVSIVVLTYNSERYVLETLDSAKNQTYKEIELIITDDHSTDSTVEICKKWLELNGHLFIFSKLLTVTTNTGIPGNCNRGVNASNGCFIKIIAGDDVLLDDCIKNNLDHINQNNVELVYSDLIFFNNTGTIFQKKCFFLTYFNLISNRKQLKVFCRNPQFLNSPSWFMKRELFQKNDGFDESYHLLEDQIFLINCLARCAKVSFLNMATVKYRVHSKSSVYGFNPILFKDITTSFIRCRMPHLSFLNFKDIIYMVDSQLCYLEAQHPNLLFKTLRALSPAKYFKYFVTRKRNQGGYLYIKLLIS